MAKQTAPSKVSFEGYNEVPVAYLGLVDSRIGEDDPQEIFPIWDQQIFKVGRDPRSNTLAIQTDLDNLVSRNHCEIYAVVYEPSVNHVYVRDRKSFNGTYVNGELVGIGPKISCGYLLEDGDVIEIRPHWKILFRQTRSPPERPLTTLQKTECKLFADKYVVTQRCLGHGAEGVVYLAKEATTKKQLVCKLVNLDKLCGTNSRDELLRRKFQEADVLRQLRHPNILPYIDAISSPHSLYTFMELASGGDLMSFIYRHDFIAELDARIIMRQVARGLSYLHSKGIIHRDLKPENILLAYSPKIAYHRIMLSDFGTCAVPRRSRMTTDVGTFIYKAPEIQTTTQPQTPAVDIWSLGIVTLLLIAPGTEDDICTLSRMDKKSLGKALDKMFSELPPKLSSNSMDFVLGCLQVAPSDRMTAAEAEYHDWFCTPAKYLEFFEKLDRRILADWCDQSKLRPMPWELPSLVEAALATPELRKPPRDDHVEPVRGSSPLCAEKSGYFQGTGKDAETNAESFKEPPTPPKRGRVSSAELVANAASLNMVCSTAEKKQATSPWENFHDRNQQTPRSKCKVKKSRRIRIHDALLLPLPGLDRHLRPASTNSQREQVLAELKRTNAKFLVDSIHS